MGAKSRQPVPHLLTSDEESMRVSSWMTEGDDVSSRSDVNRTTYVK